MLTVGGTWRTVFWFLVGFGLLMLITAILFVPESLPPSVGTVAACSSSFQV